MIRPRHSLTLEPMTDLLGRACGVRCTYVIEADQQQADAGEARP